MLLGEWARGAAAVALVAVTLAGCEIRDDPPGSDASASPTASTPTSPGGSPSIDAKELAELRAARGAVSDRMIMRQLRDAAERIAKKEPLETPQPRPADIDAGSNRALGYRLMIEFGFAADQWPALDALWQRESGWNHLAENPSSGAYGIPQSLPASKMAVVGADYRTNPETQIRWGLAYIGARYGNPDGAWAHSEAHNWY